MMQVALGLPSSTSDDVIGRMITRYHEIQKNLHFWLSDNFRPDNVLFRLEHLIHECVGNDATSQKALPIFVPFMSLAKYPPHGLRELLISAILYFSWFHHVVLGAGDRALREYFGVSPREIVDRLQIILHFLNSPFSQSLEKDPLVKIPKSFLTNLRSPKEKITVLAAVQGKKMFMTSLGKADYVIYNGNPLEASHVVQALQGGKTRGSQLGCYLMCHFTDGTSTWEDSMVQRSLQTFHAIIKNILVEMGITLGKTPSNDIIEPRFVNKVAFQGTRDQFLELIDQFDELGFTYLGIGGPAAWQDQTIVEILDSV